MTALSKQMLTSNPENIEACEYSDVLYQSILDYSMSVISDRAVPDIRDGLKPVQRRILYCMNEEGNFFDKPYKKTAKISGNVSGNYHPHGTASTDGAIVTMAQKFSNAVTLIDGQGNFGSIEGDGAAASRYTEVRLSEFSQDILLSKLNQNAVDMKDNYDSTLKEPEVLPAVIPMVLLTGAYGIAVGMKTQIPTFNLAEVIEANVYALQHKKLTTEKLLSLMPGPDFPTGGVICNASDIKTLYETGKCGLRIRGKVEFEKGKGKEKDKLVISEIPYTLVGNGVINLMQSIVDLIEDKTLQGVTDVIDETAENVRIVLELSKNADVSDITNVLYSKTKLEDTFAANVLVINKGRPETLGVCGILSGYCEFQKDLFKRSLQFKLDKISNRVSVMQAYITCINNIDDVVDTIKNSSTPLQAKQHLCKQYGFSEYQSSSILALQLQRLVSLEQEKVINELHKLNEKADILKITLISEENLVKYIVKELKSLKRKYLYPRRTRIENIAKAVYVEKEQEPAVLYAVVDRFSYVHCIDESTYLRNVGAVKASYRFLCRCSSTDCLLVFMSDGNCVRIKIADIPKKGLREKGVHLHALAKGKCDTDNANVLNVACSSDLNPIFVVTSKGLGKQVNIQDLNINRTVIVYAKLDANDTVRSVITLLRKYVRLISSDNRSMLIKTEQVPVRSRSSKGVCLMKFKSASSYVSHVICTDNYSKTSCLGSIGVKLSSKQAQEYLKSI